MPRKRDVGRPALEDGFRMFLPHSRIWERLGEGWLVSRNASVLFAVCSLLTLMVTAVLYVGVPSPTTLSTTSIVLFGAVGFLGPFAMFFLWGGMLRYWMRGEPFGRVARRFWFVVLIVGLCYGAILYYAFVYLPSLRRDRTNLEVAK